MVYHITGSTYDSKYIKIKNGSESQPVTVILDNLTISRDDGDDADDAPITVENGYALIKLSGGKCSAGIGSSDDGAVTSITIKGATITATGAQDAAGIGGGSKHGTSNVTVNGGVIVAHRGGETGSHHYAQDIGSGGDNFEYSALTGQSTIAIHGGTIVCDLTDDKDTIAITGGSVKYQVGGESASKPQAKNGSTRVYQNTLTLDTTDYNNSGIQFGPEGKQTSEVFYKVAIPSVSASSYGTTGIYAMKSADNRAKVYLYLPESGADASTADVKVDGKTLHYYGTSQAGSNNNVLKMENGLELVPDASIPVAFTGKDFKLNAVSKGSDTASGTVAFNVTSGSTLIESQTPVTTLPGASLTLKFKTAGPYTVSATTGTNFDSELYWGANATYDGNTVTASIAYQNAAGQAVTLDSYAQPHTLYQRYDESAAEGKAASEAKNAGMYRILAGVTKSALYDPAAAVKVFTIHKAHPDPADPVVSEYDLADYPNGLELSDVALPEDSAGTWTWIFREKASINLTEGENSFFALFTPSDSTNYTKAIRGVTVKVVDSTKASWDIDVKGITIPLDSKPVSLAVTVRDVDGNVVSNPTVQYKIARGEEVISIDESGTISVKKAGKAVVAVTVPGTDAAKGKALTSSSGVSYRETTGYAIVKVEKGVPAISINCPNKVFDGAAAKATVMVDDSAFPVRYSGEATIAYYQLDSASGEWILLEAAPVSTGTYRVVVKAPEDENFEEAEASTDFIISLEPLPNPKPSPDPKPVPNPAPDPQTDADTTPSSNDDASATSATGDSLVSMLPLACVAVIAGIALVVGLLFARRQK